MKAAPFAYVRPGTVPDVVAELAAGAAEDAKVLAGGQSLMPVLAMRLGRPGVLVDINAVPELAVISAGSGGTLRIGAAVRQREAQEHSATAAVPLLRMALPWVGHREIRGRGTVCGSLAHADPAAELPAVACCLGATITAVSARGRRSIAATDLFAGPLTTILEPDELLESVSFPATEPGDGFGFAEVARRHGDFALAGVAVRVRSGPTATAVCFGVADRPVTRDVSEWVREVLSSGGASEDELRTRFTAGAGDFAADVVTTGDAQGGAGYRRRLIREMAADQLARATAQFLAGGER